MSGVSGTDGTVITGLLPTHLFTDLKRFLMNLRVVSGDYKIHLLPPDPRPLIPDPKMSKLSGNVFDF